MSLDTLNVIFMRLITTVEGAVISDRLEMGLITMRVGGQFLIIFMWLIPTGRLSHRLSAWSLCRARQSVSLGFGTQSLGFRV